MKRFFSSMILTLVPLSLACCSNSGATDTPNINSKTPPVSSPKDPANRNSYKANVLLFAGDGTWGDEVVALESILNDNSISYQKVDSSELNQLSVDDLEAYRMIIWPGGQGGTQSGSLSAQTHANLRTAVQVGGVNYLGFCAGSFVAVAPAPSPGQDVSYGLGIVDGPILSYYYLEDQNVDASIVEASFADGSRRDLLWYGGPVTPNIPGGVVAKYPNGDPMITQVWSGKGFVMLSAVHPAAPQPIRDSYGLYDSDGLDNNIALNLIQATLTQQAYRTF